MTDPTVNILVALNIVPGLRQRNKTLGETREEFDQRVQREGADIDDFVLNELGLRPGDVENLDDEAWYDLGDEIDEEIARIRRQSSTENNEFLKGLRGP